MQKHVGLRFGCYGHILAGKNSMVLGFGCYGHTLAGKNSVVLHAVKKYNIKYDRDDKQHRKQPYLLAVAQWRMIVAMTVSIAWDSFFPFNPDHYIPAYFQQLKIKYRRLKPSATILAARP
jgi:hypothetical protein